MKVYSKTERPRNVMVPMETPTTIAVEFDAGGAGLPVGEGLTATVDWVVRRWGGDTVTGDENEMMG